MNSADFNRTLSILRRKECIWSKLWKEVSQLTDSEICSVISTVFPTIHQNNFSSFRSYFFSLTNTDQFDEIYKRMMPGDWNFGEKRLLLGQKYIQKEIWKRQHPQSCSNVTFCLFPSRRTGLGSSIHTYAYEMGYCLSQPNFVFTYHPDYKDIWTNGAYCGKENTMDCFFEPLTNCSLPKDKEELKRRSIIQTKQYRFTMPPFMI